MISLKRAISRHPPTINPTTHASNQSPQSPTFSLVNAFIIASSSDFFFFSVKTQPHKIECVANRRFDDVRCSKPQGNSQVAITCENAKCFLN